MAHRAGFNGAATNWSRRGFKLWRRLVGNHGSFNGAATNWSRRVREAGAAPLRESIASMGPRPIGRGERDLAPAFELMKPLQWGRDQLVAERSPYKPRVSRCPWCFN